MKKNKQIFPQKQEICPEKYLIKTFGEHMAGFIFSLKFSFKIFFWDTYHDYILFSFLLFTILEGGIPFIQLDTMEKTDNDSIIFFTLDNQVSKIYMLRCFFLV